MDALDKISSIDDVTNVYLQQTHGIGLSIHLMNELLHYSMANYIGLCNMVGERHMP